MSSRDVLRKPLIIVGSARSGTTMLGELFEVHSTVCGLVEPRLTWRYGNDKASDQIGTNHARPEVIDHIRRSFAQQVRASGGSRLVEKTPSNALRLEFVDRIFPDCRVVHIIRNGIDASLSIRDHWDFAAHGIKSARAGVLMQRIKELDVRRMPHYAAEAIRRFAPTPLTRLIGPNLWGPRIPGLREMVKELDLLEVSALQWRSCVESACNYGASMPANRYIEVKLEELTVEKFRSLLDFAELTHEPAVIDNFQRTIDPSCSISRRGSASASELTTLSKWIGPTMSWLHYPMPGQETSVSPAARSGTAGNHVAKRLSRAEDDEFNRSGFESAVAQL